MRAGHGTFVPLFLCSMMKTENKQTNVIIIIAIFIEPSHFLISFTCSHSFIRLKVISGHVQGVLRLKCINNWNLW